MSEDQKTADSHKGFTIVEALIVLAIAGIIIVMVFEVLPTLLRSGRNNQRRQDVSTILEAVSHYELIDSGSMPNDCGGAGPSCMNSGGATPNDYFLHDYKSKLTYYTTPAQIQFRSLSSTADRVTSTTNLDNVYIYNYQLCSTTTNGATTYIGAGFNNIVAVYAVETGNGPTPQCQQL